MSCVRCGKKTYRNNSTCSECKRSEYMRRYLKDHPRPKAEKKSRHKICRDCGSKKKVRPFVGLCPKCYERFRIIQRGTK